MKKRRTHRILPLLLIALLLSAILLSSCESGAGGKFDGGDYAPEDAPNIPDKEDFVGGTGTDGGTVVADRKIIKTVRETIQTAAYEEFIAAMKTALAECGGFISNSEYSGDSYYNKNNNRRASFELRIPAENLDRFTSAVGELGTVSSYNESMNDVTEAYVDIESRISVLEAEEAALLSILGKAEDVNTMLSIRTRLLDVQSDLASLRAQKQSLEGRVAYSTVYLTLFEVSREVPVVEDPGFFEEIGVSFSENLYGIGQFFRGLLVWLIGSSPVLILLGGVGVGLFFLIRALYRRSQRKLAVRMEARRTEEQDKKD